MTVVLIKRENFKTDIHIRRTPCENETNHQKLGETPGRDSPSPSPEGTTLPNYILISNFRPPELRQHISIV